MTVLRKLKEAINKNDSAYIGKQWMLFTIDHLLKQEREQIEEAYKAGMRDGSRLELNAPPKHQNASDYYDKTYNQTEKGY